MIVFEPEAVRRYQELAAEVLESGFLSEGDKLDRFEAGWASRVGAGTLGVSSGGFALWALLEAVGVRGGEVVVPTNTFMATPLAVEHAGGRVVFADCSREDLCLTADSVEATLGPATRAVVLVHVGGHLAFQVEAIAALCEERGVALVEDCAHAHGASYQGRAGGTFGVGGAYSFYATKTLPVGEGGAVVSRDTGVLERVRQLRNYGKPSYRIRGFHGRMSELTAALGLVQLERLDRILEAKRALAARYDRIFARRVELPPGMVSGYYKYIVFDTALRETTGQVYAELCHPHYPDQAGRSFPGAEWVAAHHTCAPIWYGWDGADLPEEALRERLLGPGEP